MAVDSNPMQIQQISVSGLFGIFDHVIPLNMKERITIIHGPNGFGKTAMLRMLNGFFNGQYLVFRDIPFTKFRIDFDNGNWVEVLKTSEPLGKAKNKEQISFDFYELGKEKVSFPLKATKIPPYLDFSVDIIEDVIPELRRVKSKWWRYLPTGEVLSLKDVVERFENIIPSTAKLREEPAWQLEKLKNDIHVRLIESQRLLNLVPHRFSKLDSETPSMLPTVSAYSEEIAQIIQSKLAEYGTTSQSLDRTFPVRVVQQQPYA
jgi:energy-coupling factor transporter ATP-binding protein EcfA2